MSLEAANKFLARLEKEESLRTQLYVNGVADIARLRQFAHGKGFIHRDLKPSNLFITDVDEEGPVVKMLDFGLAMRTNRDTRLTVPGTLLGSPRYMSPEQLHGSAVGNTTDIYNIGLVLHRLLTGTDAFRGKEQSKVLIAQATKATPRLSDLRPELPEIEALQWLIDTSTRKVAHERFLDVADLSRAIQHVLDAVQGRRDRTDFTTLRGLAPFPHQEAPKAAPNPGRSMGFLVAVSMVLVLLGTGFGLVIAGIAYALLG